MSLDLTQSAQNILVQQLNADNPGHNLTVAQVSFGEVMKNNDVDAAAYEAAILVTPVQGQGYTSMLPFVYKYNRIDLAGIFNSGNNSYAVGSAVELSDLIATINTKLATNMTVSVLPDMDTNQLYVQGDLSPFTLPQPSAQHPSVNCILTADPNSLIYRGEALITLTTTAVDLKTTFAAASTGLVYTPPA